MTKSFVSPAFITKFQGLHVPNLFLIAKNGGYIIHKISKLTFNRIFTKENKIFVQIILDRRVALRVYPKKIVSKIRFQTDRTRLVQFQRWANLDYNSKLESWKKTIKSNVLSQMDDFPRDRIAVLQFSSNSDS